MPERFKVTKSEDSGNLINKIYGTVDGEATGGDANLDQASEKLLPTYQDICLHNTTRTGLL